ncbi:unnamed protein product [Caenorhabditis auriculariae]|uniref:Uncharacterized protein n=1 Tax=Caenorhabditis auriculariae TaxID=2777116 RepID=A0A8S1HTM1_9PELO|nr:unnamed protein product [Caenorhabditis auriculariae]
MILTTTVPPKIEEIVEVEKVEAMCSPNFQKFLNVYSVVALGACSVLYSALTIVLLNHSKSFHPLFTVSFTIFVVTYALSNILAFLETVLIMFEGPENVFNIMDFIYTCVSFYMQPLVVLSLLERILATARVSTYENSRHWIAYACGQIICVVFVYFEYTEFSGISEIRQYITLTLSTVITLCLLALLWINSRLTVLAMAKENLTTRYQLAENIKALRTYIPFIAIDNIVSVTFGLSNKFLNVDYIFDEETCLKQPSYLTLFFIFRTYIILAQLVMPATVVWYHETLRAKFFAIFRKISGVAPAVVLGTVKIRNVLGKEIATSVSQNDYFNQLQNQWH